MPATVALSEAISSFCSELSCEEQCCRWKRQQGSEKKTSQEVSEQACETQRLAHKSKNSQFGDCVLSSENINILKIDHISLLKLQYPLLVTVHLWNEWAVQKNKSSKIIIMISLLYASLFT